MISQRTVQEIPLNGRHFVDLGLLIPGSVAPQQNGFLTAPLRGQGSFAFNTAGNREDTVNFMINGINLNDQVQNQITFQPSINTVSEFKVDNSTLSAEYGRSSGAVVNIATRSGTNELHGEVFEFFRHESMDARNFFNAEPQPQSPFKRHQFGANLGGPIVKNKTFFFATYEGLRQRQQLDFNSGVLSDAQRAAVTDPVVRNLLPLIPTANATSATGAPRFVGTGSADVDIDQWTGDVNHQLGENDRLHAYYAYQRDERAEPNLQGNTIPGFGDTRTSNRQIGTLNETHIFGPNLVNEVRFGFNRINITFAPNVAQNPADFGINNGITERRVLPQITVQGVGLNFGGPVGLPAGTHRHHLRPLRHRELPARPPRLQVRRRVPPLPQRELPDQRRDVHLPQPGRLPDRAGQRLHRHPGRDRQRRHAAGLRPVRPGQLQGPLQRHPGAGLALRPERVAHGGRRPVRRTSIPPRVSLQQVGQGSRDKIYENKHNFQPRVGVVWDPWNDGRTSVRAAYARLSDQPVTNLVTPTAGNPPLVTPLTFTGPIRLDNALAVAGPAGLAPNTVDAAFRNPTIQTWNVNVQRELSPTTSA